MTGAAGTLLAALPPNEDELPLTIRFFRRNVLEVVLMDV
jgi:hypothetical protein